GFFGEVFKTPAQAAAFQDVRQGQVADLFGADLQHGANLGDGSVDTGVVGQGNHAFLRFAPAGAQIGEDVRMFAFILAGEQPDFLKIDEELAKYQGLLRPVARASSGVLDVRFDRKNAAPKLTIFTAKDAGDHRMGSVQRGVAVP